MGTSTNDLRRYGEASADLEADPGLHRAWARATDRAVRRALLRSPALPPEVAATIVGARRSGMHTLGDNPVAPIELLADNPGARRRRDRLDEVLPGGLDDVRADPNRPELVALGSGTVDLVLAHGGTLDEATAVALASRPSPPVDPWSLALLAGRFGELVWDAAGRVHGRARLVAARSLEGRVSSSGGGPAR